MTVSPNPSPYPPLSFVSFSFRVFVPVVNDSSSWRHTISCCVCTPHAHTEAGAPRRCGSSPRLVGGRSPRRHVVRRAFRFPTSSTAARSRGSFLALTERTLTRPGEGLYRWLGEQQAQQGTGASVRPDGYGRYLLPDGEVTFYLEVDRATEPARRVKAKLDAYKQALAADPHRELGNVLLICDGRRRLANLARCAPPGPPWAWGTLDGEHYELLPAREQQRRFDQLPAAPRQSGRRVEDCLGRRWRWPAAVSV